MSCFSQRLCSTSEYIIEKSADPKVFAAIEASNNFLSLVQKGQTESELPSSSTIRIPVVIHVLYNKAEDNISLARIEQQIQILNRDFHRLNADTVNTPLHFRHLASSVNIEFVLATADAEGRATTGVVRKHTNTTSFAGGDDIKFTARGGSDAWDRDSYLNIWVGPSQTIMGYSSVPGMPKQLDGVVLGNRFFGTSESHSSFNLGRTLVHEVGHWLGLKHIWGESYCGDDEVYDTPKQGNYTSGCPTGVRSSCNNGVYGDMYMNFMDYTNDACVNMFTKGQKERMMALFNNGGFRRSILNSKGLNQPWNDAPITVPQTLKAEVYIHPNPSSGDIYLSAAAEWTGSNYNIMDATGNIRGRGLVQKEKQKLNLGTLPAGLYFVQLQNNSASTVVRFIRN